MSLRFLRNSTFFFSPFLLGAAFWIDSLWFLAGFIFVPFFFGVKGLSRTKKLLASSFFILTSALVVAYPLFSFRSVQSSVLDWEKSALLMAIIVGWVLFLASLAVLTLWTGVSFYPNPLIKILILPLLWVAFEVVKPVLSFNLQWIFIGEPLIEFPPLAVYVRLGGTYLLSFLVMVFNVSFYESIKYLLSDIKNKIRWIPLGVLGVLTSMFVGGGLFYTTDLPKSSKSLKVALVQPGSFYGVSQEDYYSEVRKRTLVLAAKSSLKDIDLMVLPGNYSGPQRFNKFDRGAMAEVSAIASSSQAYIMGFTLRAADGNDYETHALVTRDQNAQLSHKEIFFPMSEYVPSIFKKIYSLPKGISHYAAGKNQVLSLSSGVKIGIISCSEEFVPELARRAKKSGADILVITGSNDDFLSSTAFVETQRAARFRALENNVYVLQVLKSGVSSIIDPYGRVLKSLGMNEEGILIYDIPL